jgi:hypothetical protein
MAWVAKALLKRNAQTLHCHSGVIAAWALEPVVDFYISLCTLQSLALAGSLFLYYRMGVPEHFRPSAFRVEMGLSEGIDGAGSAVCSHYAAIDRFISRGVFGLLERFDIHPVLSPATAKLPLIASPTPVVLCCAGYLVVVGLGVLAIRWSKATPLAKDPFPLRVLVILHNSFLFALSALMCGGLITEAIRNK